MAQLKNSTSISRADGQDARPRTQLNFYRFATQEPSLTYFHIKTNIARFSSVMYMIEAEGYNYGTNQAIRCAWTGYMYDEPSTTIHNPTQFGSAYTGISAHGQYLSVDGYLVLRAYTAQSYFCGFNLSAYQMNPNVAVVDVTVLNVTANNYGGASF